MEHDRPLKMSLVPEEERFSKNVDILGEVITECLTKIQKQGYRTIDLSLVGLAITLLGALDKNRLIQGFIEKSHATCWTAIHSRDEEHFLKHAGDIFGFLPLQQLNVFRDLFKANDKDGKPLLSDQYRQEIWDLLTGMVKISIKYCFKNPALVAQHKVDLPAHQKLYGVKV